MTKRIVNFYVEITNRQTILSDKVLFNGKYQMERKVAIANLTNTRHIMFWSLNDFKYIKNNNIRFDINCAVQYNLLARVIHRRVIGNLR